MKKSVLLLFVFTGLILFASCKTDKNNQNKKSDSKKEILYAQGFTLANYKGYSVIKIANPWPNSTKKYTYVLKNKNGSVPDSLKKYSIILVPIQSIVVTSTTHIPSLEMLHAEATLTGFPNLNYVSSKKIRTLIDSKKIIDVGNNNSLNVEKIIELQPTVLIGYGIDNNNPSLDNLEKNGIKVLLNGDWNEQTPLGKAEWIKFFGALFNKQQLATSLFTTIEKEYLKTVDIAKKATKKPTVLAGDMFENTWYLPKGNSWGSILIDQANANYLWKKTSGTGSLALSFESVLEKGQKADFWITSGQFSTLKQMLQSNPHYDQFNAFKKQQIFSFASKKGATGGILYYELAPNRPDIVLKDLVKILHPELLKGYKPYFFEKLN